MIVLDDVHERSINYDVLFSFLKRILQRRQDLKVVITSATIDNEAIAAFFAVSRDYKKEERPLSITSVNITGRLHEVAIHYLKEPAKNYFLKMFQTIVYIDREKPAGEVLEVQGDLFAGHELVILKVKKKQERLNSAVMKMRKGSLSLVSCKYFRYIPFIV